jgi:GGDEF domain-containing protein
MTLFPTEPEALVALGVCAGVQVLVVCLSVIYANAYRERAMLLHGAATMMGVLAVQTLVGGHPFLAEAAVLLVLALDGLQLRDLVSHAGALHQPRRWLIGVSAVLLPALALAGFLGRWHLLLPALAAWISALVIIMIRAWPQSQPWARWLVPGELSLAAGAGWLGWRSLDAEPDPALPLSAMLSLWAVAIFLANGWRSRIVSETRIRIDARTTIDPLTGLSTPLIFYDRIRAVRSLMKRYGHPGILLLVHIENLPRLADEFGPEVAESALLVAASRTRQALRDGDVAARLSHARIGVLAEGMSMAEGSSNIASRILAAGLREPLPAAAGEFLHFRILLTPVPESNVSPRVLLQRLAGRMDEQLLAPTERRIVAIPTDELLA